MELKDTWDSEYKLTKLTVFNKSDQGLNFDNFDVSLPPTLAEQTAISKILSDMDDEIGLLETKKAKYTALKQGMMSELLSGRIRI